MKPINYLLVLMFAMVTFVSCDTYGDYEQEFAPIYPLSGQYYVKVLDENNEELVISTIEDDDCTIQRIMIRTSCGSSCRTVINSKVVF